MSSKTFRILVKDASYKTFRILVKDVSYKLSVDCMKVFVRKIELVTEIR